MSRGLESGAPIFVTRVREVHRNLSRRNPDFYTPITLLLNTKRRHMQYGIKGRTDFILLKLTISAFMQCVLGKGHNLSGLGTDFFPNTEKV